MTAAEMIAALEEIVEGQADPEGFYTTKEWAKMLCCTTKTAGLKLDAVKEAGRLQCRSVKREARNGRMWTVDAYRITPA